MKNVSLESSSFSLIRTDARLTGNIKITVDSNDDIWFNSIDGNEILANDKFKHSAIIDGWTHPMNVSRFLGSEKDSISDILFDVKTEVSPSMIANRCEFQHQYDFSDYFAGAKYLKSKWYKEKMSYFAPFYLSNKDIPEYFIILKISGALNDSLRNLIDNKSSKYDINQYTSDLISQSTIIKTFSLKDNTRIGKYIRNMINDANFPKSGLHVNFNDGMFTKWYGVSINSGTYSDAGELLHDFYNESKPIKLFEEYITNGYKRHGLLHPSILNLEFLFDDDTSNVFDHNRYIGFYVNESELGDLLINSDMQRNEQIKFNNYPILYSDIDSLSLTSKIINNTDGVVLSIDKNDVSERDVNAITFSDENKCISYLKDKNNNFHRIKDIIYDDCIKNVKVSDNSLNLYDFSGSDNSACINDYGYIQSEYGSPFIYFKFKRLPNSGDVFRIYHSYGSHLDSNGIHYDDIIFESGFAELIDDSGSSSISTVYGKCGEYFADINVRDSHTLISETIEYKYKGDIDFNTTFETIETSISNNYEYMEVTCDRILELPKYGLKSVKNGDILIYIDDDVIISNYNEINVSNFNYYYVGVSGNNQHMNLFAKGLAECINKMPQKTFYAFGYNNQLIIVQNDYGNINDDLAIKPMFEDSSIIESISRYDGDLHKSTGGTLYKNVVLIDSIYEKSINYDHIIRIDGGYSEINDITRYASNFYMGMTDDEICGAFSDFNKYIAVVPKKNKKVLLTDGKIFISNRYKIPFGLISFYKIKDFDFDFYSTRYSTTSYWDTYKYKIPEGVAMIKCGYVYRIVGNIDISIDGAKMINYKNGSSYFYIEGEDNCEYSYYINSGINGYVSPYLYIIGSDLNVSDLDISQSGSILNDNIEDLIGDGNIIYCCDNNEFIESRSTSLENGVTCEYDYYKENYYSDNDNNNKSKLVPYICKWGYKNGNDAYGNPYRLNVSDVFGKNNLSPQDSRNVDTFGLTNEWYYIVSNNANTIDNYCYINKPFDIESIVFDDYFRLDYCGDTKYLYSVIYYNEISGSCETFFRGEKIVFNEYDSFGNLISKNDKYDGYKFSALLIPKKIENYDEMYPSKPIEYILTKDDDQKYILFYINLYLDDASVNRTVGLSRFRDICSSYTFDGYTSKSKNENGIIEAFTGCVGYYKLCDENGEIFIGNKLNSFYVEVGDIIVCTDIQDVTSYTDIDSSGSGESFASIKTDDYVISYNIYKSYELYPFMDTLYYGEKKKSIDADYRIKFDENGICNLTYSDMYSFISKKYGPNINEFSTINIPTLINVGKSSNTFGKRITPSYFDSSFFTIINEFDMSAPLVFRTSFDNDSQWCSLLSTSKYNTPVPYPVMKYCDNKYIYTSYDDNRFTFNRFNKNFDIEKSYTLLQIFQVCGGNNYFRNNIFKKLTFGYIMNMLNNSLNYVDNRTGSDIKLTIEQPSTLHKLDYINVTPIYLNGNIVNYTYNITDSYTSDSVISNNSYMYRYSGFYDPIFNDIIEFSNDYEYGYNTKFNSSLNNFGVMKNFNHLKVSNGDIFTEKDFTNSEITGNTTIGHSDMQILHTSWDLDFHKLYTDINEYINVPGTLRIQEDDTFVNNIIKLPEQVRLTKFKVSKVDDVNVIDMSEYQLAYSINDNIVTIRINYKDVLIEKLIELGIKTAFDQLKLYTEDDYINYLGMDFNSYIKKYITTNIIDLYGVDSANVFGKTRVASTDSIFDISTEDFDKLKSSNFSIDKNVKINNCEDYIADFTYYIKSNFNPVINFVMTLKLI